MMNIKHLIPALMVAVAPMGAAAQGKIGIDLKNLDTSVRPQDDFYQFATGGWQKRNPLPAAYSRFGSFDQLQENNNKRINSILTSLLKKKFKQGTVEQKLADFYALAMDSARRDREGIAPVKPLISEIEKTATTADINALQLKYAAFGYGLPFSTSFQPDDKNVTRNIMCVYQGGLTLGQKDYYVNNDSATVAIREAYRKHITRMFQLYGFSQSEAQARSEAVFAFETALALISKSNTELRDPKANYNLTTLSEFNASYPNLHLEQLLNAEGIDSKYLANINVGQPQFLAGADKLLAAAPVSTLKALMEWSVINSSAGYLSSNIEEANFDFFGRTMSGRKQNYPLWKRATAQVESQMGEALGRIYVQRYFPASSKKMMEELVHNLQVSLGQRIDAQTWMSDTTKAAAHQKLDKFYVKIGYPNKWKDLSQLNIDPSKSYFDNVQACRKFWDKKTIEEKAGKPVDRDEWFMTPQTVNAYYNPTTNEICFPAGILQPPFFDANADEAFNYGAIGVVIGHEMTHGFDDQGRQYDANGNMKDWWTANDAQQFNERADLYANFFSNIKVLPDLNANGRFTLGENLADHGGLQVAYNAFKNATKGKKQKTIDGFTPDQRFFLAYAGVWAQNITDQEIRNRVKRDPHALGKWRVDGALPHIDAWYKAFNVKAGDKMYLPESQRLQLW